ncbi:DUF4920 domain-containing protein [Mucilaginibacter sp. KACC 22063]|uniref:DUF4920 domain-containing protein n=1 Tax=Mucilaginibacter sp. KACC 22063 TaxID=3025666 RepID=UPI00236725A0|nr:DUF4920 domain-containing protein [Mucilaginibacter sp. KACC 22063]WDF55920.1 DUF4920 domain-containing protein [Mucilaginibacter sp. KACC 22063]
MKRFAPLKIVLLLIACFNIATAQKHTPLPHGMLFGSSPSNINVMPASKIESFMGKRTRTNAVITGKVIKVTKPKGGWFIIDAGQGKTIEAHFKNYNITLPIDLKGREVIVDGIAEKIFVADDMQHLAGESSSQMKSQHSAKPNPKQKITFEVKGLMVNK